MICLHCEKSFLMKKAGVPCRDGWICNKCFEALGFDPSNRERHKYTKYEDLKNGREYYEAHMWDDTIKRQKEDIKQAALDSLYVRTGSGSERPDVDATEDELKVFEILQDMVSPYELKFKRTSDSYVVATLGTWHFARFKFSDRTAWISFPPLNGKKKNELDEPEDVRDLARKIDAALVVIEENS